MFLGLQTSWNQRLVIVTAITIENQEIPKINCQMTANVLLACHAQPIRQSYDSKSTSEKRIAKECHNIRLRGKSTFHTFSCKFEIFEQ
ncbi:Hypothetical predicted protein [Cloeon dipterum]|uniref:Uncharacterized protein n=1 Tax=Cloeon dipterum TaxID=197152 RepID=A0A8S1E465_9INSE|nr:Hypothetical predicted protein [Cloeon dipterum]